MVPKVPALSYREARRLLHRHGFQELRQTGSHVSFRHPDGRRTVVPRHGGDIQPKLLAKILKDAGIDPDSVRR
jgi:predicted RNA binding protein YcfA (HicA-like mRNA interferase family)